MKLYTVFDFQILQGGGGAVTVNASLANVTVIGFGKTLVAKNSVDPVTHDFHTELKLPRLRIDGKYEMFGKILVIPLQGRGNCWFDARKYTLFILIKSMISHFVLLITYVFKIF